MARKLLSAGPAPVVTTLASARTAPTLGLSGAKLEARLRMKRSSAYIETLRKLDAGGHTHDRQTVEAFVAALRDELPDITIDQHPVGIVSQCYLGEPYEVHTLDRLGNIIHHYKRFEPLPPLLARGRVLAASGQYAFVEIYTDKVIAVAESGDVSIVRD
ncbi:nuclear transport factor 2 family protein [Cupriavidus pampae]|uniref:Uncharacterized protein n=1 Tax=Cupriavidus pampae TaxID=659251 RepID=A0ABM8WJ25_9BURK|nr:hypothetical protein [Cupriavidus pampae]CAG9167407.1 hypothetical protein LMG32289_01383 [Cupriavidus pampae]